MKKTCFYFLAFTFLIFSYYANCQLFTYSSAGLNLTNSSATTITSCPSPTATGVNTVDLNVSGVGVLNNTGSNELLKIKLSFYTARAVNLSNMVCYLLSPGGTCIRLYDGQSNTTGSASNLTLNYVFRNGNGCVSRYPRSYNQSELAGSNLNTSRIDSMFTIDNANSFRDIFNGQNANGTWKFIFVSKSSVSKNRPNLLSASLLFGDGTTLEIMDRTSEKGLCGAGEGSSNWDGTPTCFSNRGPKTPAEQTADNNSYPGHSPGGCEWNNDNNYTNYIQFTATESYVCLNVMGNSGQTLQSIVLQPNPSTLNPCTASSPVPWNVISCPRNSVYGSSVGTDNPHNHCFNATPGETYYLVVDGSGGGVNTNFTVSGIEGLPIILGAELLFFDYDCDDDKTKLKWATVSESINDYFVVDYSENGQDWMEIGRKQGAGSKKTATDYEFILSQRISKGYFRLKQVDFNGKKSDLKTIVVENCSQNQEKLKVIPNPSKGIVYLLDVKQQDLMRISVVDILGNEIYRSDIIGDQESEKIDLSHVSKGVYVLVAQNRNGEITLQRIVIE